MFQSEVYFPVVLSISEDPTADDTYPMWRAPAACEIKSAYAIVNDDVAANTDNHFSVALLNGGAAGTATTQIGGSVGGTAGWTGLTPKAFTLSSATLSAGDVLTVKYDETGTATFNVLVVQADVHFGT